MASDSSDPDHGGTYTATDAALNGNGKRASPSPSSASSSSPVISASTSATDKDQPTSTSLLDSDKRPYQKRIRLSLACNQCRKRKVRCDTTLPKCRNCVQRNEHCETSDLRRPDHGPGLRQHAVKDPARDSNRNTNRDSFVSQRPQQQPQIQSQIYSEQPAEPSVNARHDKGDSHNPASRPAPPRRTPSQSSLSRASPVARISSMASGHSPRQTSHNSALTPDSESQHLHASESAASASGNNSGEKQSLSWVERAYRVAAADSHKSEDKITGQNHHTATIGNDSPADVHTSTPDVVVNTDDTAYRVKFVGGSSLQCLCTFVDLHLTSKGLRPVSPGFRQGMQYCEEFELPLTPHLPTLPVRPETDGYVAAFMRRVWPLYPVVDEITVAADIDYIMQVQALHGKNFARRLPQLTLPTLAVIYAILALGSAELAGQATPLSTSYLTAAYSLYGHLISLPYTVSVQALLLMSLVLRAQMRDGQAWQVLGQALRIAYSIGLHRTSSSLSSARSADSKGRPSQPETPRRPPPGCSPSYTSDAGLHSRIWWSCYSLERLVQLESGRPAVVHDRVGDGVSNIDSDVHSHSDGGTTTPTALPRLPQFLNAATHGSEYFVAWVSLAHIMGKISDQFYGQKPKNSVELFTRVYRLDQMLNEWKDTLPDSVRLRKDAVARASRHAAARRQARHDRTAHNGGSRSRGHNSTNNSSGAEDSGDEEEDNFSATYNGGVRDGYNDGHDDSPSNHYEYHHHLASFLSLQHYVAQITLLRIALIFPHADFLAEITKQREFLPRATPASQMYKASPSAHSRLVNAADICLGAARSIVTEATTLADDAERSVLLGANPMLLSGMVLALGILRQPLRRLARADLQLFHLSLELVEEYLGRWVVPGLKGDEAEDGGWENAGGTSGSGLDDMMGIVALLRDQVDAYHAQSRSRVSAAATMAAMSNGAGQKAHLTIPHQSDQGTAFTNDNNNNNSSSISNGANRNPGNSELRFVQSPSQQTHHSQQQAQAVQYGSHNQLGVDQQHHDQFHQHLMGPQGFSASHFTSSSPSDRNHVMSAGHSTAVPDSTGANGNGMPPPPLPLQSHSSAPEGAGSLSAMLNGNNNDGTDQRGGGIEFGNGGSGGNMYSGFSMSSSTFMGGGFGGGGSTGINYGMGGTMGVDPDAFEGLAFDELWNMIGTTDIRGEYSF